MLELTIKQIDGVPRVRDIDLAEALGFERPRRIRSLIDRHTDALEIFGRRTSVVHRPPHGGAAFFEYWLNEKQALYICTKSEARRAVEITLKMVEVFADWRSGRLPAAPAVALDLPSDLANWLALVREMRLTYGKAAARQIWAQSPLPAPATCKESFQVAGPPEVVIARQFLLQCCQVTGNAGDFVRSSKIRAAYIRWNSATDRVQIGPRAWANAFRSLGSIHSDALSGARFWPAKRSNTGYGGLRLG